MTVEDTVPGAGLEGGSATSAAADIVRESAPRPPRPIGRASWLDWLTDRLRAAPGPLLAVHTVLFVLLAVLGHSAFWLSGTFPPGTLIPLVLVQASFPTLSLAMVEVFGAVALRSLRTLRPALTVDDAGARDVAADLVRTPRGLAAGTGLVGLAFGVTSVITNPEVYLLGPGTGAIAWLWMLAYTPVVAAIAASLFGLVVHQVRVVMRVHRDMVRVDLFGLDPLYAFSNLTAVLGLSGVVGVAYTVGSLVAVGVRFTILELAWFGTVIPIAILVFVIPLLGLHGRIESEKARRQAEAGDALERAVEELHRRLRAGNFEGMAQLNDGIAAATSAYMTISKVSTWPWRPETLRGFLSAVALPIVLWVITALLGRMI